MRSLKSKWLLPYIILLCASVLLSVLFGYYMAKQTMYDNFSNSKQKILSVKVDNFYEKYNNSSVKFSALSNNEILKTPMLLSSTVDVIQYTDEIVSQIKPFMFDIVKSSVNNNIVTVIQSITLICLLIILYPRKWFWSLYNFSSTPKGCFLYANIVVSFLSHFYYIASRC